jgi:hypothetical protein
MLLLPLPLSLGLPPSSCGEAEYPKGVLRPNEGYVKLALTLQMEGKGAA